MNAVSPGAIETPMHAPEMHGFLAGLQPMGRMGRTQDVVDAVLYLERAPFVTGEILHVDGGAHAGHWWSRAMWPNRRLIDLLEIEHPIVLAPMAGFGTVELAAAVCDAGGLGSIGCGPVPPAGCGEDDRRVAGADQQADQRQFLLSRAGKSRCRPRAGLARSAVALLSRTRRSSRSRRRLASTFRRSATHMCKVVEDVRPDVVSFHFGLPAPACWPGSRRRVAASCRRRRRWRRRAGWKRAASMWSSPRATKPAGIAGCSSHPTSIARSPRSRVRWRWCHRSSMPSVSRSSPPAGSPTGEALRLRLRLARAGTQIGTAYLLCPEAATPPLHRDALRQARRRRNRAHQCVHRAARARAVEPAASRARADDRCRARLPAAAGRDGAVARQGGAAGRRRVHAAVVGAGRPAGARDAGTGAHARTCERGDRAVQADDRLTHLPLPRRSGLRIIRASADGRHRDAGTARAHRSLSATAGALLASALLATAAVAQTYPSAPVKVIVPFGAGGATDVLARVFADRLQQRIGQPFTVENRGGAAGQIAATAFARAPADGYTLMFTTAAPITIAPLMNDKVQYDPRKDFVPVALVAVQPVWLVVNANSPLKIAGRHRQAAPRTIRASSPTAPRASAPSCISPPRRCRARPESRWCMCRSAAAAR